MLSIPKQMPSPPQLWRMCVIPLIFLFVWNFDAFISPGFSKLKRDNRDKCIVHHLIASTEVLTTGRVNVIYKTMGIRGVLDLHLDNDELLCTGTISLARYISRESPFTKTRPYRRTIVCTIV